MPVLFCCCFIRSSALVETKRLLLWKPKQSSHWSWRRPQHLPCCQVHSHADCGCLNSAYNGSNDHPKRWIKCLSFACCHLGNFFTKLKVENCFPFGVLVAFLQDCSIRPMNSSKRQHTCLAEFLMICTLSPVTATACWQEWPICRAR